MAGQADSRRGESVITCKEGSLVNSKGLKLFTREWTGATVARNGTMVLIHGYSFHSAYFEPFARRLVAEGFRVLTFDLQGHGRSEAALGIRGYVDRFNDYVDDLQLFLDSISEASGAPVFLYGESMGGLLLLLWALRQHNRTSTPSHVQSFAVDGVILSAPVIRVAPAVLPPWPLTIIIRLLSYIFPRFMLPGSQLKDTYLAAFGDKKFAQKSLSDPLILFEPPRLRFVDEVIRSTDIVCRHMEDISMPFLVMHGEDDIRTEARNSVELHEKASSKDKTLKLFPGMKHQLLQDTPANTEHMICTAVEWLRARINTSSSG